MVQVVFRVRLALCVLIQVRNQFLAHLVIIKIKLIKQVVLFVLLARHVQIELQFLKIVQMVLIVKELQQFVMSAQLVKFALIKQTLVKP